MRPGFAQTSNVQRFKNGMSVVEDRGAREASMMLVTGDPGFGKTATVFWWATMHGAVYLRAKANYTPFWLLSELVQELKGRPSRNSEDLSKQAVISLVREPRPIIIDEVEHTFRDLKVLETIRDLVDLVSVPVVLVGTDQVQNRVARYAQFSSRIASVVQFRPASVADVRICCDCKCEIPVADDLVEEIHRQAGGRIREVMNAIAVVERQGKARTGSAAKQPITLSDMAGKSLTHDWQARRPRMVRPESAPPAAAAR
ncbi:MAG: ATP-binding protein [Deltaproteobacteria bacterium]|nr:ATP-binding protein [Deltaproteobacteria bacterium]